jgi:hypothetical protein
MNLYALSSTHPSAALVMIKTVPLSFEIVNNFEAYSSISYIFRLIYDGSGRELG